MGHNLRIPALACVLLGALAACVPVYVTPHGGSVRADTSRTANQYYRATDGRVFPTRAARNAYERQLYGDDARAPRSSTRIQRTYRRTAQVQRQQQRLEQSQRKRLRAERRRAQAIREERQARREAKRARRAAGVANAQRLRRAEQAAIAAERRAAQRVRGSDRISRRQQRVDNLAPRPGLAPATTRKIEKYSYYRRKGENTPAFVTRVARAERRSSREGQSVAYWLNDANHTRRRGASEK